MDWSSLSEHWRWLSPPSLLLALLGWLGRRKGLHPWEAFVRQFRLNKEVKACQQDLATCEESRANEQHAREYAMVALREITQAAALVKEAADTGRLTNSEPSPSAPGSSPGISTPSPPTPADPPATRSKSGASGRDDQ